jgi:hypothetical protein
MTDGKEMGEHESWQAGNGNVFSVPKFITCKKIKYSVLRTNNTYGSLILQDDTSFRHLIDSIAIWSRNISLGTCSQWKMMLMTLGATTAASIVVDVCVFAVRYTHLFGAFTLS